jgi:hypothetical protein
MTLISTNLILGLLLSGLIGAAIAQAKKSNLVAGFVISVLLGPIGWLLVALSGPDRGKIRSCPACLKDVPIAATACSGCGRDLPPAEKPRGGSFRLSK